MSRGVNNGGGKAMRLRRALVALGAMLSLGAQAAGVQPFIIDGQPAPDEELAVGIYFADRAGPAICTGVAIARHLVLTAGHCACGFPESYIVTSLEKMPREAFRERTLKLVSDLKRGLPVKRFPADDFTQPIHGAPIPFDVNQCAQGYTPGSDLALLVLDRSYCGETPACPEGYDVLYWELRDRLAPGARLKVVGYGRTETGALGERRVAQIPILTGNCVIARFGQNCAPFKELILSEREAGSLARDTCGGDSGGPVFLREGDKWLLIAITSRGTPGLLRGAGDCGGGGIYELLGRETVRTWLEANIARLKLLTQPKKTAGAAPKSVVGPGTKSAISPFGDLESAQVEFDPTAH